MGLFPGDFLGDALGMGGSKGFDMFGGGSGGSSGFNMFGGGSGGNGSGAVGGLMEGLFGSFTPAATPPRSLYGEAANTLGTYKALSPDVYAMESEYRPKYAALERNILTDNVKAMTDQASAADPRQAALLAEMNTQALDQLKMGATLDPSLAREVQQSVRAGQSARGLALGPAQVYQESMQTGIAGQAMQDRRRAYAGQVAGANLDNIRPYLSLASTMTKAGPSMVDMWNPYASDLYNTNYNAEAARNIAAAANRASVAGSLLGAAGKVGGAMI